MKLIPFARIARRLPSAGKAKHLHPSVVYRWHRHGTLSKDGQRIRLQALKVGGRWCSSWKWVKEYFLALTGEPVDFGTSPRREKKEREALEAELARRGI